MQRFYVHLHQVLFVHTVSVMHVGLLKVVSLCESFDQVVYGAGGFQLLLR